MGFHSGSLYLKRADTGMALTRNMVMRKETLARYFPVRACTLLTGVVSRSSIVPLFFSSANRPIVSIGIMKRRTTLMVPK